MMGDGIKASNALIVDLNPTAKVLSSGITLLEIGSKLNFSVKKKKVIALYLPHANQNGPSNAR